MSDTADTLAVTNISNAIITVAFSYGAPLATLDPGETYTFHPIERSHMRIHNITPLADDVVVNTGRPVVKVEWVNTEEVEDVEETVLEDTDQVVETPEEVETEVETEVV